MTRRSLTIGQRSSLNRRMVVSTSDYGGTGHYVRPPISLPHLRCLDRPLDEERPPVRPPRKDDNAQRS